MPVNLCMTKVPRSEEVKYRNIDFPSTWQYEAHLIKNEQDIFLILFYFFVQQDNHYQLFRF